MNQALASDYPTYEDHQRAWEELAAGIARLKPTVREIADGEIPPNSKPGTLTIIGSGIETIGFSIGDEKIIQAADKVLFCVADPATVVWLKRIRPDSLDLYVLYGEDKVRYVTYMQMTEAQLYWVRQGLDVVVVFYGHPGIFVLSTHRAVMIARREGHRAKMKAGVCALDTLCADLGVDPCHPGLQTHEATDCLTRRRRIDTSLHVVLWQVGLIGELGYRRHGYLNSGFSYFVNWLIESYGPEYQITHYVASRYPTIEPLIAIHALKDLHDPEVQSTINGISTFYLPPRDVVPTDRQTAVDLGLLKDGQSLTTPKSPLREIGLYGPREMLAFDAFRQFSIPKSYRWQGNTRASNFLIELRFDTSLQNLYRHAPEQALNDPRFVGLSDRERQMLASRDSGAIQIAAKGTYVRSEANENMIHSLMVSKKACFDFLSQVRGKPLTLARKTAVQWAEKHGYQPDWSCYHATVDHLYRTTLSPWTGVYVTVDGSTVVTLIGHRGNPLHSILYVNDRRIRHFTLKGGMVQWFEQPGVPFNGFLKLDLQSSGDRRLVGKLWPRQSTASDAKILTVDAVDPATIAMVNRLSVPPPLRFGSFILRSNGRFTRVPTPMVLADDRLIIAGKPIPVFELSSDSLIWSEGTRDFYSGNIRFLRDPVAGSIEIYGECRSQEEAIPLRCYGARQPGNEDPPLAYDGPPLPGAASKHLATLANAALSTGGLMLWHKWEKAHLASLTVAQVLASLA
ncbi:hypothetical protein KQH49_14450 [Mycetohabitans sp. B5]|uniref:Tetrapyrrole (Corrin/porphyrin) methylase-like protein n=1 Tax=Mycetohabitans endofungorum TaxID=417203 RepID=A0A2P5K6M3_9BURK|nr:MULTISPECIES: SAM-dependent methyltransferase [Mycetohabitans]MCG1056051.1 hypothetical protein [Mycetohabitans sp. B5]PPB80687.1 tetrapyrrole (corrin/porphyrin) methylase-like protein [Mycetohabitans endofungorum]